MALESRHEHRDSGNDVSFAGQSQRFRSDTSVQIGSVFEDSVKGMAHLVFGVTRRGQLASSLALAEGIAWNGWARGTDADG